jgi:hypothetical protein
LFIDPSSPTELFNITCNIHLAFWGEIAVWNKCSNEPSIFGQKRREVGNKDCSDSLRSHAGRSEPRMGSWTLVSGGSKDKITGRRALVSRWERLLIHLFSL